MLNDKSIKGHKEKSINVLCLVFNIFIDFNRTTTFAKLDKIFLFYTPLDLGSKNNIWQGF